MSAESNALVAPNYHNDFVTQAYLPWLRERPRLAGIARQLVHGLEAGVSTRMERSARYGIDIPKALAISLTSTCNRHCVFCRVGTSLSAPPRLLPPRILDTALAECRDLGIRCVALVGGEPLLYPEVDSWITGHPDFLFVLFTNGLALTEERARRYQELANLAIFLNVSATYSLDRLDENLLGVLHRLRRFGLFFGFSATVYQDNWLLFSALDPFAALFDSGARFATLFRYLPEFGGEPDPLSLAPRAWNEVRDAARVSGNLHGRLVICAPEDERIMGGCLAAGRLLIHLDPSGHISPCPFVPYSAHRLGTSSLLDALKSGYFTELRARGSQWAELGGACVYRAREAEFLATNARHGAIGCP